MEKNKGFSLIELMIVVAIIGILSLISLPVYNRYIVRIETTRVLTDLMYIARIIHVERLSGSYNTQYTADKLKKLAPNTSYTRKGGCIDTGVRLNRYQWTDKNEIAKILNNRTSKVKILDIETFEFDSSCKSAVNTARQLHQTFYFLMDYEGYGVGYPTTKESPSNGVIDVIIGGGVRFYDKNNNLIASKGDYDISCGVYHTRAQHAIVNKTMYPQPCRQIIINTSENNEHQRNFYPMQ